MMDAAVLSSWPKVIESGWPSFPSFLPCSLDLHTVTCPTARRNQSSFTVVKTLCSGARWPGLTDGAPTSLSLGKVCNLSGPQESSVNRGSRDTYLTELVRRLTEGIHVKS